MAIYVNGVLVAGDGVDGKDATINGVNALNIEAAGGLSGRQSGDTYTISGSSLFSNSGGELYGNIIFPNDDFKIKNPENKIYIRLNSGQIEPGVTIYSGIDSSNDFSRFFVNGYGNIEFFVFRSGVTSSISIGDGIRIASPKITLGPSVKEQYLVATEKYVDDLVGNINTALTALNASLDSLNGEVV